MKKKEVGDKGGKAGYCKGCKRRGEEGGGEGRFQVMIEKG